MSSSDGVQALIATLNNVSNILNSYLPIFIYTFGIVGNLLNILVLSHRALRSNPSTLFLLISSIAGLIAILSGLTSRMMSGYATDLTSTVDWICKLRNVILYSSRTINLWTITLAAIDRWLSSSVEQKIRAMSNLKNFRRSIIILLIYTCIINTPIIYCYQANLIDQPRQCYGSSYSCRLTTDLIYAFGTTLLPLSLMLIFGWLTLQHIRHGFGRISAATGTAVHPSNKDLSIIKVRELNRRKMDRNLFKMLLIQVTLLFLLTFPHGVEKVYSSLATTASPNSLRNAIEKLISNTLSLFSFIASGMPFYIYTLSGGSLFRNTLFQLIKKIFQKFLCRSYF